MGAFFKRWVLPARLQDDNEELRKENRELKARLREAAKLETENAELRRVLQMREKVSEDMIVAERIGVDQSPFFRVMSIRIDRGEHYVRSEMAVLDPDGVVGRIDKATYTNVVKTTLSNGRTQIKYHAKLLVAWGNRNSVPSTIPLKLPLDVSSSGQQAFAQKYGTTCVDFSAHDVDAGTMFYYYRPARSGCNLAAADLNTVTATLSPARGRNAGSCHSSTVAVPSRSRWERIS